MLTISNTLDQDYLIIEPTGVGYLSSILNNLNKVKYDRIRILEAITIVDALFILDNLNVKELDLCLLDQIENASIIVVSKNENLSLEEKEKIKNKLQNFNQKAKIIVDKHYKELDSNFYQDIFLHLLEGNKEKTKEIKTPDLINFSIK